MHHVAQFESGTLHLQLKQAQATVAKPAWFRQGPRAKRKDAAKDVAMAATTDGMEV